MDIKKLSDDIAVCGQITVEDIAAIKDAGFATIICNRPDGESPDQPTFADIAAAAATAGLAHAKIPITPGQMSAGDIEFFGSAVASMPKPVLAYCRSGARSASLVQASDAIAKARS